MLTASSVSLKDLSNKPYTDKETDQEKEYQNKFYIEADSYSGDESELKSFTLNNISQIQKF